MVSSVEDGVVSARCFVVVAVLVVAFCVRLWYPPSPVLTCISTIATTVWVVWLLATGCGDGVSFSLVTQLYPSEISVKQFQMKPVHTTHTYTVRMVLRTTGDVRFFAIVTLY